jgi:hypothetical protein
MPFAGMRDYDDASSISQGIGYFWSSSPYPADDYTHFIYLVSSDVFVDDDSYRANGYSIRSFKDSYMTPDSTWTVVQGTL